MINVLYAVAVTLLVALVSVVPASLVGRYVPGIFNPGLQQIAVAAWISGLISWFVARAISRNEQEAMQEAAKRSSSPKAVGITVALFALAVGVVVVLHFFGEDLL